MKIDLSSAEAALLDRHLLRHIEHVDDELVHTDKRELQHAIARELEELRALHERLTSQIAGRGE